MKITIKFLKPGQIQIIPEPKSFYGIKIWEDRDEGKLHNHCYLCARGHDFEIRKDIARPCAGCGILTNLESLDYGVFVCSVDCAKKLEMRVKRESEIEEEDEELGILKEICVL